MSSIIFNLKIEIICYNYVLCYHSDRVVFHIFSKLPISIPTRLVVPVDSYFIYNSSLLYYVFTILFLYPSIVELHMVLFIIYFLQNLSLVQFIYILIYIILYYNTNFIFLMNN